MNLSVKKLSLLFFLVSFFVFNASAQQMNWVQMMRDPSINFYDVQSAFNQYYNQYVLTHGKEPREENGIFKKKEHESEFEVPGFEQFKRWEWFNEPRFFPSGNRLNKTDALNEYNTQVVPFLNQTRSSTWTIIGPTNSIPQDGGAGRINFIRFMPGNNSIIFAGAPSGGLWKSTDGGASWSTSTDALAVIGCTDLAIDPTNTNIMYLATGDRDAGDTYSVGVLKSTDGGNTWNSTGLNYNVTNRLTVGRILINPTSPGNLIAVTNGYFNGTSGGIWRSTNSGTNWTQVGSSGNYYDAEFKPGDPSVVYACTNRFYKSTDGGLNFSLVTGIPSGAERMAIAVSANNAAYVYAVTANTTDYGLAGFYRSTNSGTAFTLMNSSYDILGFNTDGSGGGGQGWYDLCVDASPLDANAVVVGGINTFKSSNGGTSWSIHGAGYGFNAKIHPDVHEVVFAPGTSNCFVGCDGGVFKTTNNGSTFTDLSDGLQIAQPYRLSCAATNANIITSGWQDNGTNRVNAGTWDEILGGDGMETIISWSSSQTVYGELYYGEIYKSTNGGNTFGNNPICNTGGTAGTEDEDGAWVTPYVQDPNTAATLYVGKSRLYKTTNSGSSFTACGAVTAGSGAIKAIAVAKSNSQVIYCAKNDRFWVSTNGGTSFTDRTAGLVSTSQAAITYIAVDNTNSNKVYVSMSGYVAGTKVYYSSDAGVNWTNISNGLPNLPVNTIVYANSSTFHSIYCGTDVGVYYRDDNTGTWITYTDGLPNVVVNELEIQYSNGKIRAATYGRGIWECDLYSASLSAPTASFVSDVTSGCAPLSVDYSSTSVFATGFSWQFTGGNPSTSTVSNPTVVYNAAGTYNVKLVVTNALGADSVISNSYITVGPSLTAGATGTNVSCFTQNDGSATVTVNGGTAPFTYAWSNGGTTAAISNLASNTYTCTVTDALGCAYSASVTVTQPGALLGTTVTTPDNGTSNGTINLIPTGGTQPWTYVWSTGATVQDLGGLAAGTYTVTITDVNGCMKVVTAVVGSSVGIAAIDEVNTWLIYPNPTHGWLMIDATKVTEARIELFNLLGQKLFETKMENANSTQINLAKLPVGEYWLKITTDKGVAYRKVMKD